MKNDPKSIGLLYLFATFFMWGSVYVAGKLGSAQMSPFLLAALRCGIAAPVLLVMARKHLHIRIDRADYPYFLAIGALGYLPPSAVQFRDFIIKQGAVFDEYRLRNNIQ